MPSWRVLDQSRDDPFGRARAARPRRSTALRPMRCGRLVFVQSEALSQTMRGTPELSFVGGA